MTRRIESIRLGPGPEFDLIRQFLARDKEAASRLGDAVQVGPNLWKGHIVDPRNGSVYRMEMYLKPDGALALRGYLGIPLLGQTQTWTRYTGPIARDCRLTEPGEHPMTTRPGAGAAG